MAAVHPIRDISISPLRSTCSRCSLHELCLPAGLDREDLNQLEHLISPSRLIKRGAYVYRAGSPHKSLYALRVGFLKSSIMLEDGTEQIIGFHMPGDLIGWDGIDSAFHPSDAIAVEDSQVCEVPFTELERLGNKSPALQQHVTRLLSKEITHDHGVMLLLGSMQAKERLAVFLLNLSQRYGARGYSPKRFSTRMARQDIGSFLGLKLETISRQFRSLADDRIIEVNARDIEILDPGRLTEIVRKHATP